MTTLTIVCRLLIAAILIVAALGKLLDLAQSRRSLREFGVPPFLAAPLGVALPVVELAVAVALLFAVTAWWGAVIAAMLFATFGAVISVNLSLGRKPRCNCFGQLHSAPIGKETVAANAVALTAATFLIARSEAGIGDSLPSLLGTLTLLETVVAGMTAVALAACAATVWFLLQPYKQNGRLLQRIEALEKRAPSARQELPAQGGRAGLSIGAVAPAFELPALAGARRWLTFSVRPSPSCSSLSTPIVARAQRFSQTSRAGRRITPVFSGSS
jgi:uncharacterized membrane protein YphA (DoxX/SURF4 family)